MAALIQLSQALRDARSDLAETETFAAGHTLSWNTDPGRWQATVTSRLGLTARGEAPPDTHLMRPRPDKPNSSHTSAGIIGSVGLVWAIERGRTNVAEPWLAADDIAAHLGITKKDTVHTRIAYVFPSRRSKYEDLYNVTAGNARSNLGQAGREQGLKKLMTVNLLKRLESSVDAFRLTLAKIEDSVTRTLGRISSHAGNLADLSPELAGLDFDVDDEDDANIEGQNLQDCDYLINYDIHWNPVRIIQRFGRIDRIGSTNSQIQLVNFWPDISLDEYINLKERVENRMVIADLASTADDNVLTLENSDAAFRKEQLRKLQDEVIELEDVRTGVSITDLGLNDFRMDLLGYIKEHGDLDKAPRGLHAVIPADPSKGLHPGVIFALRNLTAGEDINRGNRLHPHYLVYLDDQGKVIANHTEAKHLLDLLRVGCRPHEEPVSEVVNLFNAATGDGSRMDKYSALLTDAIRSMIETTEERDIDSLFTGGSTTALTQTIAGLDDFELTAFVAVVDPAEGGADD